ncbi:MAG: hypothetical protein H6809_03445 [Phycisphaeraceae bacterium]|nr:hypothetical protein [Phycisphaeraceae bacterium]
MCRDPIVQLRLVFLALAFGSFLAQSASGQPLDDTTIRDLWRVAELRQPPSGIHVSFRVLRYPRLTPEELSAAEARIAPFPEHPERQSLADERRRNEDGPDVQSREFWILDPRSFRSNVDSPSTESMGDVVVTPEVAWAMGQHALKILDPEAPPPPSGDLGWASGEVQAYCQRMFLGGLASYRNLEIASIEIAGDSASITAIRNDGVQWRYDLSRLPQRSVWAVTRATLVTLPARQAESGGYTTFSGWREHSALPSPLLVPDRIEQYDARGRLTEAIDTISVEPIDATRFAQVSAIPTFDGVDAVRGPVSFTVAHDYRPTRDRRTESTPNGIVTAAIPAAERGATAPSGWRVVGWIVALLLAAALVVTRVLHRARASRAPRSASKAI